MSEKIDQNTLMTRLGRGSKVTGAMAGLATKLAGEKLFGLNIERTEHAEQLMLALGNLKGPLMKVGQILATIPEALPPEYAKAFQQLQSNAPPMGWAFVRRRMRSELGPEWQTKFAEFGTEAAAAASLGQVHRAKDKNGRDLACKLQYPDMKSAIASDIGQLKLIFSLYERVDPSIKTAQIYEELSQRLYEELDYVREAKHTNAYAHILKDEKTIHVPEIVAGLSTDRLLTSTWLDGKPILTYKDAPLEDRNTIALNMFRAWYVPLYYYGIIHGDPHMGNYSIRNGSLDLNLLDFGCIRVFPPQFVGGVIELYHALMTDDRERAVGAYESWGFANLSNEVIDVLNIWARFLYDPIMDDQIRTISTTNNGVYGREKAQEVHKQLKTLKGNVQIPREFVFMDRAALGLGSVFIHLQAEVNWHQLFEEMISVFSVDEMNARQHTLLNDFGLIEHDSTHP